MIQINKKSSLEDTITAIVIKYNLTNQQKETLKSNIPKGHITTTSSELLNELFKNTDFLNNNLGATIY